MEKKIYSLTDAVSDLKRKGYLDELLFENDEVVNLSRGVKLKVGKFMIDSAYQFESGEKGEDTSIIYAVSANDRSFKGLFIDALNLHSTDNESIKEKMTEVEHQETDQNTKFGLPKIHKADFNDNPSRYVLRREFPDFPQCPFGQSFSMLGFDTENKEYVWLVTSIIKDERLKTEVFEK